MSPCTNAVFLGHRFIYNGISHISIQIHTSYFFLRTTVTTIQIITKQLSEIIDIMPLTA